MLLITLIVSPRQYVTGVGSVFHLILVRNGKLGEARDVRSSETVTTVRAGILDSSISLEKVPTIGETM